MSFIRELKRKLRFKLIKLEEAKFNAYVRAFKVIRDKMLADDPPRMKAEFDVEDAKINAKIAEDYELAFFTEVGKALSAWASLEQIIVIIASKLMSSSIEKAGVVMYSIINFGTWLSIVSELFPHDELCSELKPKWDKLTSRLRALKDTRDRLAHHRAFKGDVPAAYFKITSIAPSPFDVRAKSLKYKPLQLLEIKEFVSAVIAMMEDLRALTIEMEAIHDAHDEHMDKEIAQLIGQETYDKALAIKKAALASAKLE
ncbi:hypothetical protein ACE103_05290 [Bradyrhizobium sp. ma5]|uniref:hypothetical protein n=1 Tax=Bradyrhizobium sp. ma5 TaxID=3344828 RepID=UPI0035D4DA81